MPYEGEFAQYKSLRRIAESRRVKELLGSFRVRERSTSGTPLQTVSFADLSPSDWLPDWVLAVDGSHAEVMVQNGYPQAEASYITVASVLLDVDKIQRLDAHRPVDPREFRTTEQPDSIDCALPGCNVILDNVNSARDSLRRSLLNVFENVRMSDDGESLLDTYEVLLDQKPISRVQRCPNDDCPLPHSDRAFTRGTGEYSCACPLARPLYSTDGLRIHEGMNAEGTNGAMFAEVMQVLERIWLVHILRTFEAKDWLPTLQRLAIVLDGPLAVFGHPAWLSQAISSELSRINEQVRAKTNGQDILWLGIEKTGAFVDHFNALDVKADGSSGAIEHQSAILLDDQYIKQHIIFSTSEKPYGQDTYFGRKFFYKTSSGARVVATVPCLTDEHRDTSHAEPDQFPRLRDAVSILDRLVSSRYPNALAPLVAAHAEAAIPLHLGERVLERLAHEWMAEAIW